MTDYSVLIVDSDTQTQSQISELLKDKFDIERIMCAQDKDHALAELNNNTVQCIIIGSCQNTADMTYEFVTSIREKEKFKDTAVLLLSEDNSRETLLKAAASGANEIVSKPISTRSLGLKLKRIFQTKAFRKSARISLMGALNADLEFAGDIVYTTKLIDFSVGGFSVRSPLLSRGGCVYDTVKLHTQTDGLSVKATAELIRIEKDPETANSDDKKLILAFEFKNLSRNQKDTIDRFLDCLTKPKN